MLLLVTIRLAYSTVINLSIPMHLPRRFCRCLQWFSLCDYRFFAFELSNLLYIKIVIFIAGFVLFRFSFLLFFPLFFLDSVSFIRIFLLFSGFVRLYGIRSLVRISAFGGFRKRRRFSTFGRFGALVALLGFPRSPGGGGSVSASPRRGASRIVVWS